MTAPYDWAREACPSCGSTQARIACRCMAADRLCARCHQWSHVNDEGVRVLGAWHTARGG